MIIPVQRKKYNESTYEKIINLIEDEEWEEGMRIPSENELAEEFHVSKNDVNTAIRVLHTSGILDSKQGIGTFVSDGAKKKIQSNQLLNMLQDEDYYDEVIEVRAILEKETAFLAAQFRTDEDIKALEEALGNIKKSVKEKNVEQAIYWGNEFHTKIAEATKNKLLLSLYESVSTKMITERKVSVTASDFEEIYTHSIESDEKIIEAIKNRDENLARDLMDEHIFEKRHC